MKEQRKITAGIIVFIGLIVWCLAPAFAQVTTYNFHPDGTMTNEHDSHEGYSIERYDDQMRILEQAHYFAGGVRKRLVTKYRYENNMLVEKIGYNYTEGYDRETYKYNEFGYETEYRSFTSQTEGNWKEITYIIREFDERNNESYFRVKHTGHGDMINTMTRTTYDYANRTRSYIDYKFDANDREISARSGRGGMADWQFDRAGEFVFDINKHGENLRSNRVVSWSGRDESGNEQEIVFMNSSVVSRSFDRNGRVIQIKLGDPDSYVNDKPIYGYDEFIDYRYDNQGRLIESISEHYSEPKEKRTFSHGRSIEVKHYRETSNGAWKLISTKNHTSIDLFVPKGRSGNSQAVATSVQQQNSEPISSGVSQSPPSFNSNSAKPSSTSGSLVNDLIGLNIESNESESLSVFALDAEKLTHIADVLSHTMGVKVTEEQVLALAMQLLIENYNADLREMNTAYLKDKVSVFD